VGVPFFHDNKRIIMNRRNRKPRSHRSEKGRRIAIEQLEDRCLLSIASGIAQDAFYLPQQHNLSMLGGYLSAPASGTALDIAMEYLTSHAADLGVTAADILSSTVTDEYFSSDINVTHIYLRQELNGIAIANATMNVNVTSDGRVLSVGGGFVSGIAYNSSLALQSSSSTTSSVSLTQPKLSAAEALLLTGQALGVPASEATLRAASASASSACNTQATSFTDSTLSLDPIPVELAYVATSDGLKLTWDIVIRTTDNQHWYDINVDSDNGQIRLACDWVNDASYDV
jgi:hypothetical protein